MTLSFRFATETEVAALLKLCLAVHADQARRYGNNRWATTTTEKSVARGLRLSRVLVATRRVVGALATKATTLGHKEHEVHEEEL